MPVTSKIIPGTSLLDGVRVLEAVGGGDEPAAGDQRGPADVSVAVHLEAHLPGPGAHPRVSATHDLGPLPGSGATTWEGEGRGGERGTVLIKQSSRGLHLHSFHP